ncbi:hypothetical protein ACSBQY_06885 [Micrococcus lylae]|uniref:hypothetical protein n=1 Tax=Micrococcus lylae TaxID=1273 RepID=UPI003EBB6C49
MITARPPKGARPPASATDRARRPRISPLLPTMVFALAGVIGAAIRGSKNNSAPTARERRQARRGGKA